MKPGIEARPTQLMPGTVWSGTEVPDEPQMAECSKRISRAHPEPVLKERPSVARPGDPNQDSELAP